MSSLAPIARMFGLVGLLGLAASACAPAEHGTSSLPIIEVDGDAVPPGWRVPDGPCQLDPPEPSRLALTTTDFATGSLTVIDVHEQTAEVDVAEGSTDAVPFAHGDRLLMVHRHQHDRLDVLRTQEWSLVGQHGLAPTTATSSNPHAATIGPDGLAYITLFAEPALRVLDLDRPPAEAERARIDLSNFADDDGNPELSLAVTCGDLVMVTAQRLGPGFVPSGTDHLIVVDPKQREAIDLVPETPEAEGLPLLGEWVRQLRRDPADARGLTVLALSRGIERINLGTGHRHWAVPPERFAEVDIDDRLSPQAFDVDEQGEQAYLAAYDRDFSQVRLYRVGLDGHEPATPEPFANGFDSVERSLELVGDHLWYGSTRTNAPGLWLFEVGDDGPSVVAGPITTGLPPYSMVAIP
ncbi:MAG: hypothetical protein AAGF11_31555 [Myxococcota bacterium]